MSLRLERQIDEEKKQKRKYVVALDGHQQIKITQQPTKSTWRNEGGEGGELQPARGAQGKRESIVWGQLIWVAYQITIKSMCLLKKKKLRQIIELTKNLTTRPRTTSCREGHWLITSLVSLLSTT